MFLARGSWSVCPPDEPASDARLSASAATIHASAVLIGARALLIRGPSGSGKSALAWRLVSGICRPLLPFARLVGDDRVRLSAAHGRLLVEPAPPLAGLLEVRGFGIRILPFEPRAVVGRIVDLGALGAERMPAVDEETTLLGVSVLRSAFPPGADPISALLASIRAAAP